MLKLAKRIRGSDKNGFTLVEMIVVIVIIAILAAALVTSLVGYVNKAKNTAAETEGHNVYTAAQAYIAEQTGKATGTVSVTTSDIAAAVNTYIGGSAYTCANVADAALGSSPANKTFSVKYDSATSTVTDFVLQASNGRTVSYHQSAKDGTGGYAAGWTVSGK